MIFELSVTLALCHVQCKTAAIFVGIHCIVLRSLAAKMRAKCLGRLEINLFFLSFCGQMTDH